MAIGSLLGSGVLGVDALCTTTPEWAWIIILTPTAQANRILYDSDPLVGELDLAKTCTGVRGGESIHLGIRGPTPVYYCFGPSTLTSLTILAPFRVCAWITSHDVELG